MRIIAYKTEQVYGKVAISESTNEFVLSDKLNELFAFLIEPFDNSIRVCWNLDTTVSLLLRLLSTDNCSKLRNKHRLHIPPYKVFYIKEKVFTVEHIPSGNKCSLYGLQQYFPSIEEPEDLQEVQMFGEKLMYELKKMGMEPTKLTSPVAIYNECIMSKLDLPQLKDMPIEAAELAFKCAGKLWIEAHQIGYWQKVYDYDMVSAFPTVAQGLRDIRQCKWIRSSLYQGKAIYGYTDCMVTIYNKVMVSPIIYDDGERLISPTGSFRTCLTKGELDFIDTWKIGEYEILDGWWCIPNVESELSKPLYEPIKKLLKFKGRTELQTLLAKRMSTGVYGKFGEEWEQEFGNHFNPCYFAEISTQTRLLVASWLYANGIGISDNGGYKHLIQIGVDGVTLDCPVEEVNK